MEKITSNVYIFFEIFDYLGLKDLLVVAKVSSILRNAIIEYLQMKYKKIEVFKTYQQYIVSNTVATELSLKLLRSNETVILPQPENRILLGRSHFLAFLNLNSNNVETLLLHFNDEYQANLAACYYENKDYFSKFKFDQLKRLGFGKMYLTEAQVNYIINYCPNLKELYIGGFLARDGAETTWFTDIPVKTLDNRKIIKCLGFVDVDLIDGYYSHSEDKFIYYEHLMTETIAETNVVNLLIESNSKKSNLKTKINQLSCCEVLAVGQYAHKPTFKTFREKTLNNLINLRKLTIVSAPIIEMNKDFFIALNSTCKNLEYLQLEYCNVKEFVPVYTLTELKLNNCLGLSWKDLKTILTQPMKLKSFSSTLVRYKGQYECFNITEQLQHLKLYYNDFYNNIMPINSTNLTSLHWSSTNLTKQTWINATNCPNIHVLEVKTSHILYKQIRDFKCLKKLILTVSETLSAEDLWNILQHPSLIYVALNDNPENDFMNYETYFAPQSWNTSILFLDVCFTDTDRYLLIFWLTLLTSNLNLTMRIKYNCQHIDNGFDDDDCFTLLSEILGNSQRLSCLKTINVNVCGYNIDLSKLNENFEETAKEATTISLDNFYNNKMQYILLKNNCA